MALQQSLNWKQLGPIPIPHSHSATVVAPTHHGRDPPLHILGPSDPLQPITVSQQKELVGMKPMP